MKIRVLSTLGLTAALALPASATITVVLSIGQLFGSSTSSVLQDGALVQLVASTTDSSFGAPTANGFVSGDDVLIASFNLNSGTSGMAGVHIDSFFFTPTGELTTGDALILRWFPTLSTSNLTPIGGAIYGEFAPGSLALDGGSAWTVPNDNEILNLNFLTQSTGVGSNPDSSGVANKTVVAAIPEPSTYAAIFAVIALAFAWFRRRKA